MNVHAASDTILVGFCSHHLRIQTSIAGGSVLMSLPVPALTDDMFVAVTKTQQPFLIERVLIKKMLSSNVNPLERCGPMTIDCR